MHKRNDGEKNIAIRKTNQRAGFPKICVRISLEIKYQKNSWALVRKRENCLLEESRKEIIFQILS